MSQETELNSGGTNQSKDSKPDPGDPAGRKLREVSWSEIKSGSGLTDIEKLDARISKIEDTTDKIHHEIRRHHIFRDVVTHLLAVAVAASLGMFYSNVTDAINSFPEVDWHRVERGAEGVPFIMP